MTTRSFRLAKTKEIERVMKLGHARHHVFFTAKALPNKTALCRSTVVASTKTSKKAVIRNRLKRQLRELIRTEVRPVVTGMDLVIIIRPAAVQAGYAALREAVRSVFRLPG